MNPKKGGSCDSSHDTGSEDSYKSGTAMNEPQNPAETRELTRDPFFSLSLSLSPLAAGQPAMAVEIAGTHLHRSAPPLSRIALSPKSIAFAFSSLPHTASRNSPYPIHHSHFIGAPLLAQKRRPRGGGRILASTNSASLHFDDGDGEDDELPLRFDPDAESRGIPDAEARSSGEKYESSPSSSYTSASPVSDPISALPISTSSAMPPDPWPESNGFMPERVERSANSFHLPLSLRILKKKMRILESEGAEDSTSISVKNAFSSMVFIVREIQSHMILMREALFSSSNLQIQAILARVHDELHASFVWLFQRVFSRTPTLMVYLMLLLANFTVFSIAEAPAVAASPPPSQSFSVSSKESPNPTSRFDSSAVRTFSIGRSAAVGGGSSSGGGPGNPLAVSGAADDGRWDHNRSSSSSSQGDCTISSEAAAEEEMRMWKGVVETAEKMRAIDRHEALMDPNTLRWFVSPITVEAEPDDLSCYSSTELSYRRALSVDPDDPLILSNFAQFLYVVLGDHDRAEEYFKRAARAEPPDAEALSRYANFLWVSRKDLGAAEETFLEAIAADPGNSYYSGNYAHFLWSTGGEDTCYPLDDCDA